MTAQKVTVTLKTNCGGSDNRENRDQLNSFINEDRTSSTKAWAEPGTCFSCGGEKELRSKQSKRSLSVGHSGLLEAEPQPPTFWKHHLEFILNDALAAAGHWPFADCTN